jgi:hypothetical protein
MVYLAERERERPRHDIIAEGEVMTVARFQPSLALDRRYISKSLQLLNFRITVIYKTLVGN